MNTIEFIGKKNVDYTQKSGTRDVEFLGHYIAKKRLSNGNAKLHNILVFDLPAVQSCLNCESCKGSCYALKAEVQYADCRVYRSTNLYLAKNEPEKLQALIEGQLNASRKNVVRIHGSGDFFSQEYIDLWAKIITNHPEKKFYAYTKVEDILDFSKIEKLENFNLITSFVAGKLNYGSLPYIKKT